MVKAVELDIKLHNLANGNYTAFFPDWGRADEETRFKRLCGLSDTADQFQHTGRR
jgi:hypothetical protein